MAIGYALVLLTQATLASANPLIVSPDVIDAGSAAPGETVSVSFVIENVGTESVSFEFPTFETARSTGADFDLEIDGERFVGLEFRAAADGPLSGEWSGFSGMLDLTSGSGGTWTNDLAILLTNTPELDTANVAFQVGGNSSHFAAINQNFPWPSGIGDAPIDERIDFAEPIAVDGLYAWVGNAWPGGEGTWSGTVSLFGLGSQTNLIGSVSPSSGQVAAGESVTVEAVFDPGERAPGDYEEFLLLTTDQPGQPELSIPVRLSVLGQATLAPLPARVEFGDVVAGTDANETLIVENTGNEPLVIESIGVNDGAFSVSADTLEVAPFSSAELVLGFAPEAAGDASGALTFSSNDIAAPTLVIELAGTGVAAPAISLDPASAALSLEAGGQTIVSFDIVNSGDGPLEFVLPAFVDQPAVASRLARWSGAAPAALAARGASRAEPPADHPVWQRVVAASGRSAAGFSIEFEDFEAEAGSYEVVAGPLSGELTSFIADFVLESASVGTFANDLTLLIATTPTPDLNGGEDVLIQIGGTGAPLAPVFAGWGSGDSSEPGTVVQSTLQAAAPFPLDDVYVLLGNGWVQGIGVWSGSIDIVDLAPDAGPVVGANPSGGTVAPGESVTVELEVSAADLVEGTFPGRVEVVSNDPILPTATFELSLEVSGTPALNLSAPALDFGELFIGQTRIEELVVTNSGSAALTLSGFEIDDDRFDIATDAVLVEPGASAALPVAFSADSAGSVVATLEFASDDPDNASVAVPLSASVLETPALVVEPASIQAALAAGETATVSLDLSNPGNGLLEFEFPGFATGAGTAGNVAGAAIDQSGWVRVETGHATDAGTASRDGSGGESGAVPLSGRSASLEISLESFEAFGGDFVPVATDLSGSLDRIDADFVLEQATGLTWANDLALVITTGSELTADSILLQVGGTFTLSHGGVRLGWGMGSSSEPGTAVQTSIALDQALALDGAQAWIGNAWVPEDSGQWSGVIGLDGVLDGTPFISAVSPASGQIEGGGSLDVEVSLSALDLVAGIYRDRLRLTSNDPVSPSVDIIADLSVSGEPELAIAPDAVDFGTVFAGATESASIVVSNPGTDVLLIDRVEASGEGFSVDGDGFSIPPGASAVLAIEFFSETTGDFSGQLEVTNNASDATAIVELTATVQDPGILTISDTELTLDVSSGATAQTSLTLGNIGASPLAFEASPTQSGAPDGLGQTSAPRPALSMVPSHPVANPMPLVDGLPIGVNEDRDILWEQVPNGSFGIISTSSTELDAGFYAADRFEVDGAALVQGLTVHGFRFDDAGRFDEVFESVVFYVYDDADGQPAGSPDAAEAVERFRFEAGVGTPGFSVAEDSTAAGHRADVSLDLEAATGEGLLLPEGRYWLVVHAVSASADLVSDTWAMVTSLEGSQSARFIDIENILDLGATNWQPLAGLIAPETSNLAFRIEGQALSFLSLTPTQGVIDVEQSQAVELLFDATDFPPGSYATMLMIRTDSPATPEVAIPVTMVVSPGEPGLNWVNLDGPSEAEIVAGQRFTIHGSARLDAAREHELADVEMWVGFHDHDSHPGLWPESAWVAGSLLAADGEHADFSVDSGAHLAPGVYRYATRFRLADGRFVYGGYHETGGGFWDGLLHVSGRLNVLDVDADRLFRDRFRISD